AREYHRLLDCAPGWTVRRWYSRGPVWVGRILDHKRVGAWEQRDVLLVQGRQRATGRAVAAVWVNGRWDYGAVTRIGADGKMAMPVQVGARALLTMIKGQRPWPKV
ncbi:MAG: hypothetical protein ACRCZP_08090, partial [Phycicoccus sp.]